MKKLYRGLLLVLSIAGVSCSQWMYSRAGTSQSYSDKFAMVKSKALLLIKNNYRNFSCCGVLRSDYPKALRRYYEHDVYFERYSFGTGVQISKPPDPAFCFKTVA